MINLSSLFKSFYFIIFFSFFVFSIGCGGAESVGETPETIELSTASFSSECASSSTDVDSSSFEDTLTVSDQQTLDCQLHYSNEELEVSEDESASISSHLLSPSLSSSALSLTLRLVASIDAPTVDGNPLGASDVFFNGSQAVVTYNTQGEPYQGAIQVVDVSEPTRPRLLSQTVFESTDMSTGIIDDTTLYLVGAQSVDETGFTSPAEILSATLDGSSVPTSFSTPVELSSYVGTDLVKVDDALYVTTGNTGGVIKLDPSNFSSLGTLSLSDARSIDYNSEDGLLYVFQAMPGQVAVVNPDDLSLVDSFTFDGGNNAEAKSTVEVADNLLFLGAGDGGVVVMDPADGTSLASVANPTRQDLSPELQVANAVTVQDDLLFISNGQAGIRAALWQQNEDHSVDTSVIGKLAFTDGISANGIDYHGDFLMVASGLDGLRIVKVLKSLYLKPLVCASITAVFCEDFDADDGTKINDGSIWAGKGNNNVVSGEVIDEGGRINSGKYIETVSTFDASTTGKHYSVKLFKSGIFNIRNNQNPNLGVEMRYDGSSTVTGYIGYVNNANKRKTANFSFPSGQSFMVMHVYQEGTTLQVAIEGPDGNRLETPSIALVDPGFLQPMKAKLYPINNSAQPADAPSFDDVLVEDFSF